VRILFISDQFPYPLDTGGNVRTYHLLRGLAAAHEVVLVSATRAGLEAEHIDAVRQYVSEVHLVARPAGGPVRELLSLVRSLVRGTPFLIERHRNDALQRQVDALTGEQKFDAVHFNHLDAAMYGAHMQGILRILDQHNVVTNQARTTLAAETSLLRRAVLRFDLPRLTRSERDLCNTMQACLVCSDDDARWLSALGVRTGSVVVPNGVDLSFFQAARVLASEPRLMFVGTLDYDPCEKGVWYFCNEILPLIRARLPEARFVAVGRNPSARLRAMAGPERGIEFTGRVEDLRPLVHQSRVFVVPLLSGSGTRLKILEGMAMGVPVVSTSIGAEGIVGVDGEHLRIADDPRAFAQAVLELLRDDPLAQRLRARGRELVERHYSWQSACARMLGAYSAGVRRG
jgi:sugar transferase (PEP-CTERM/EpsH1 system associated)